MFLEIAFAAYVALLLIFVIYAGLNFYRIESKIQINAQIVTFLLPFIVNFFVAKFLFEQINPFLTTLMPCLIIYFLGRKLKQVRIFGLTGSVATGKSTLLKMMEESLHEQLFIIDCDKITRELSYKGNSGYYLILKMLGDKKDEYLNPINQEINREKFSDFVFSNEPFRKRLTADMGKRIFWEIAKQIYGCMIEKKKLIMIDAPILFQTKVLTHICFPIIVVGCSSETQIKRMVESRGLSEEEAKNRVKSQMPLEVKKKKAEIYVENNGTPEEMFTKTLQKLNKIIGKKKKE